MICALVTFPGLPTSRLSISILVVFCHFLFRLPDSIQKERGAKTKNNFKTFISNFLDLEKSFHWAWFEFWVKVENVFGWSSPKQQHHTSFIKSLWSSCPRTVLRAPVVRRHICVFMPLFHISQRLGTAENQTDLQHRLEQLRASLTCNSD